MGPQKAGSSKKTKTSDGNSGNHDSTGHFAVPEEPSFMSKPGDRKKAIQDAKKRNPHGIQLINPLVNPKDRHQVISGYLGLTETIPLRIITEIDQQEALDWKPSEPEQVGDRDDVMPESGSRQDYFRRQAMPVARALAVLAESKAAGFGADGIKPNFSPTLVQVLNCAMDHRETLTPEDLDRGLPLSLEHQFFAPHTKTRRALASVIVGLYHIIQARPSWFHHSSSLDADSPLRTSYLGGICPEDWNAALTVWRWYAGTKQLEKTDRAQEQAKNASVSNWKNQPSTRAIYLTDDNLRGAEDDDNEQRTTFSSTAQYAVDAFTDERFQLLSMDFDEAPCPQTKDDEQSMATALASIRAAYDPKKQVRV
jgi:hypothetical protein